MRHPLDGILPPEHELGLDLGEIDAPAGDATTIEVRQRQTVVTQ